ncbi:four helix bundle protein [Pontibacter sp. BT731]|uniref:four helix bundle protein n=1 Tax=Pontibacter coccineus TaxID=3063328 RepID=UPI0026E1EB9D|nr:four helix bundle protein [Pontibacter sp. BT731]MDO6390686.1 four helix bundle protein [Pontibacter sp. BT731]
MEEKKYLKLNDIEAYKISFALSNHIWDIVIAWSHFPQNTVGQQYATAADSISANIAEGFGRYGKKDKIKFYRYAQGSMYESFNWTEKARVRKLITEEQYQYILGELKKPPIAINSLIKWTNNNLTI